MILNQKLIPIVLVVTMVTWVVAYAIDTSSLTQEEIIQIKRTELEDQNARIELHNKMFEDDCTIKALDKYPDDTKERNKFRYECIDSITTPLINIESELQKYSSWTVTHASSWVASWKEQAIPRPKVMDKFWLSGCRLTNTDHELKRLNLSWYGYDYACIQWKTFPVYAPADVSVEKIWYDANLWQYIVLRHKKDNNIRFVLWHIWSQLKEWQFVREWEKIWDVIEWKNGSSSGTHLHMEIWYGYTNVSYEFALGLKYKSLDGTVLLNDRRFNFWQPQPKVTKIYRNWKYIESINYAWNKWKDLDFIATIEQESKWDSEAISDIDNPKPGAYSYWYCQYNSTWHMDKINYYKSLPTLEDKIDWCHEKYIEAMDRKWWIWSLFHWYSVREKVKNRFSFE